MRKFRIALFLIIGILCLTAITYAAIPRVINYQGRLTDKDDNPLTGNFLVTFRFYDAETLGQPIWEEGHILTVKNGLFSVLMGSVKPLEIDFNKNLWLGMEVASDGEMTPRIKLASSVYALNAKSIDMISSSQLLRNDIDSIMSGSLTLKKDLILKGDTAGPSKVVLSDIQGREYYIWMDTLGNLRLKQGMPASDTDGAVITKEKSGRLSAHFIQSITLLLLLIAIFILVLILYSSKKK
ncbi:MAG: hypothetical protein COS29_04855 [Candidatus Omnitrophica bacterium CG02_land_8_20_14_3_00__42_8]|nr:MAG: hypothetical protein COS29_04855 [Candidatus Omnitrophica bacterium CG02_land_8_20_14_3_00__42_8]PIW68627.1 MAG: hypothetical protein COW10_01525 [Candidatus Omnitrophica bacterium CG12_big_fil_rev_8_21_14_0_65_42_8]